MEYYFREWLLGIVEDDPLPYGIKYLNFIITQNKWHFELALTGSEYPFKLSIADLYYPLEAQCFFCEKYFKIRPFGRKKIYDVTKKLILNFFAQQQLCQHFCPNGRSNFDNLTISLGFRGKKAKFLVKI